MLNTETKIYNAALKNGMPPCLATLITAQSKHESNNYQSRVFKLNNNLFGYKFVGQAGATQGTVAPSNEGNNGHYARYELIEDSVTEICKWIKRRQKGHQFPQNLEVITTPELYAGLLKGAGYYGAPLKVYIAGLKRYLANIIV